MDGVVYNSSFVPAEWIAAHGLRPVRLTPSRAVRARGAAPEGACAFAAAFHAAAGAVPGACAVVYATTCDQMRRISGIADLPGPPRFLLNVPATWQSPAPHRYYRDELRRLGAFLERLGGRPPSPELLAAEMERSEANRERLQAGRTQQPAAAHAARVAAFHETGELPAAPPFGAPPAGRPLMLLGAPLCREDFHLLELVERAGGRIAVDATEGGEREWPRRFERGRMHADPFEELADAYFGTIPAVFRRPNTALQEWLRRALERGGIRGIVAVMPPWCDLWRAEIPRLREWAPVPVLTLDLAGDEAPASAATRIQAFLEVGA